MLHKIVYCFSGQGSQYYKMGKELYAENSHFRFWMNHLDGIVQSLINESVLATLYHDKYKISDVFDRTLITHPAIFMFEYSLYQVFIEKGYYPDLILGVSLGEFTSAAIAGALSYEDALKLVVKHAQVIEEKCTKGGMLAILSNLSKFDEIKTSYPDIEMASINSGGHFVISGKMNSLQSIERELKAQNIVNQILPVSYAFHSRYINEAAPRFKEILGAYQFKNPAIPYISSCKAAEVNAADFNAYFLWDVGQKVIQLKDTIEKLEASNPYLYVDLGPSGTIVNLIRQNLKPASGSVLQPTLSPFGRDSVTLNKALDMIKKMKAE